ncbi:hypothetical protein HU200_040881 [Digitaria exilis]|uniref:Uncharacterized protein n=1 Tax=Digitaria exilis TaxID=1010633 RepID=A0A835B9C3_9POAL|nr:hypothetical protein HU200_040881 [Digitaria exilis]
MNPWITQTAFDEKWARFEDFATNLLLFHDNTSSLDEFLVCSQVYNQRHVDRWLHRGIDVDLDGQFTYLLSTCPVMEDLELMSCKFPGGCSQGITFSTLKKLVLNHCENNTSRPMVIMAPNLSCFDLTYGFYLDGIVLSKMDSLVEAMIEIKQNRNLSQNTQRGLLGSLFNVKSLELSGFETKVYLLRRLLLVPPLHT